MQKNATLLLLFLFLLFIQKIQAQQAIVPTGGNATGTGGISSYTIGQVVYTTAMGSGESITQGVQQPFDITTLGIDEFPEITLVMTVYPNPTTSFVNLKLKNNDFENLMYQLFDLQGKRIASQKISQMETQIQMENLPVATYLLSISNNNKVLKTFKIIKKQ